MSDRANSIFVSYRRDDSKHAAGRLVDQLATRFGPENLFLDVDSIALGKDFVEVLSAQVAKCQIMLVVIGPGWITASDGSGARRLENPRDFVRIEVETALARDIRVIPVLVDGAEPFGEEDLPDTLAPLARRQAIRLDHESFHVDVGRLADALSTVVDPPQNRYGTTQQGLGTGIGSGTGSGTGEDTTPPVMSAEELKDSLAPDADTPPAQNTRPANPKTVTTAKPAPAFGGWLVALSPLIFAALLTAFLVAVGETPRYLTIWERYGNYWMNSYEQNASRVADGYFVFATAPVALATLWFLVRLLRRRMGWMQSLLFILVAAGTWITAINIR